MQPRHTVTVEADGPLFPRLVSYFGRTYHLIPADRIFQWMSLALANSQRFRLLSVAKSINGRRGPRASSNSSNAAALDEAHRPGSALILRLQTETSVILGGHVPAHDQGSVSISRATAYDRLTWSSSG